LFGVQLRLSFSHFEYLQQEGQPGAIIRSLPRMLSAVRFERGSPPTKRSGKNHSWRRRNSMTNDERHRQCRTPNVFLCLYSMDDGGFWNCHFDDTGSSQGSQTRNNLKASHSRTRLEPGPVPDQQVTRLASTSDHDTGSTIPRLAVAPKQAKQANKVEACRTMCSAEVEMHQNGSCMVAAKKLKQCHEIFLPRVPRRLLLIPG